jgi:hypothetical protein
MAKSSKIDINQMFLKAHKKAVKNAIEVAARTRTLLVSHEDGKVKMVKPTVKYLGYVPIDSLKKKKIASRSSSRSKK